MTVPDSAVFVDTEAAFTAVADVRRAFAGLAALELVAPVSGHGGLDEALAAIAAVGKGWLESVAPQIEAIAEALTVGAIDTARADGGD